VVGETWFILGTYAFYARQDVRSPVRSMVVRVVVTLSLMAVAWLSRGSNVLVTLGLALSVGSLVGAAHIGWQLRDTLPRTDLWLPRSLIRTLVASLVMVAAARVTLWALRGLPNTKPAQLLAILLAALVGGAVFLAIQAAWRAPELGWLRSGLVRRGAGGGG
jgi:putative peptidoglycan lipid II flippase